MWSRAMRPTSRSAMARRHADERAHQLTELWVTRSTHHSSLLLPLGGVICSESVNSALRDVTQATPPVRCPSPELHNRQVDSRTLPDED